MCYMRDGRDQTHSCLLYTSHTLCDFRQGRVEDGAVYKEELLMSQAGVSPADRPVVKAALDRAEQTKMPAAADVYKRQVWR